MKHCFVNNYSYNLTSLGDVLISRLLFLLLLIASLYPALAQAAVASEASSQKISVIEENSKTIISIPMKSDSIAAAATLIDNRVIIVFDKKMPLLAPDTKTNFLDKISLPKLNQNATLVMLDLNTTNKEIPDLLLSNKGNAWVIEIAKNLAKPNDLRVISRPLAAPRPKVEVEFNEKARNPIVFTDPITGNQLVALTVLESAAAILQQHSFIDFIFLKTLQGGIIQPISDSLNYIPSGLRLSVESGSPLNIAPRVYKKSPINEEEIESNFKIDYFLEDFNSVLPIKPYQVENKEYYKSLAVIRKAVRSALNQEKAAVIYANWAFFNLANGLYYEGLTQIKSVKLKNLTLASRYKIKLLEGVLLYMNNNYAEAYNVIRTIDINSVPINLRKEVRFWIEIISYMSGQGESFLKKLDPVELVVTTNINFLSLYPDEIIKSLIFSIIDYEFKLNELDNVQALINRLSEFKLTSHEQNRFYNFEARLYASHHQEDKAVESWDKCIADYEDLLNRTQCRYDKIEYLNSAVKISLQDYVKELEHIAILWRGDALEAQILKSLGDAYEQSMDYPNALRSWNKILISFPYSSDSLMLSKKMGAVFVDFFLSNDKDLISDFKSLAFFYEFQYLLPNGEIGDEVIMKFVDNLIALDLFERASALLTHQINNRLEGAIKEKAINKLAELYLQDQNPYLALDVLQKGDEENLTKELEDERKYLLAKCYSAVHDYVKAINILNSDYSAHADEIKASVFWQTNNWREFIKYVEPRIYQIREYEGIMDAADTLKVLKLLLSYILLNEDNLTEGLYRDFKNRLPDSDNSKLAHIIYESWKTGKEKKVGNDETIKSLRSIASQFAQQLKTK